jgi:hypothetical protein
MRKGWLLVGMCWLAMGAVMAAAGQGASKRVCECGAHPPGPPKDREVTPYAGEPDDMKPYAKFATPYDLNYIRVPISMLARRGTFPIPRT